MRLRIITSSTPDPFYNIALEQALHELAVNYNSAILRFWKNPQSVVIGRVQDIYKEVNLDYCQTNDIPIIRRISGGGTVYHDYGNLNISLILPIHYIPTETNIQAFSTYITKLIINALHKLGLDDLQQEGDTNIFYKDKKISGSAGHLHKGWFLHHATLLFSTDLDTLDKTILARDSHPKNPKASRYFPTTNLVKVDEDDFKESFIRIVTDEMNLSPEQSELSVAEDQFSLKLQNQLYTTKSWIYEGKRKLIKPDIP